MFSNKTSLLKHNPPQLNYGVAVTDVDADGQFEFFVAGFGFPNLVLKWDGTQFINIAGPTLSDNTRQSIGVAAGDFDGDGREEIYVLNTDTFMGRKRFGDRLFAAFDNDWLDLFSMPRNQAKINQTAGRSVACLDRKGTGQYGFLLANYGGPLCLYELDRDGVVDEVAEEAGLAFVTGGRSLLCGPVVSDRLDIFAANENSPNFLFRNKGDGTFEEMAWKCGLADPYEHARGVALIDANRDGRFDIVCGNWEGAHRLFVQTERGSFIDLANASMSAVSRVRTVIAADFDNDGYEEIFFNNIGEANRLFGWREGSWQPLDIGDAAEPLGLGTGAAVADLDGDGRLELLISHGEATQQPLGFYHTPVNANNWLRVLPLTRHGAPARGALVKLYTSQRMQMRVIDSGSGYLCQMEPVAHFGLGSISAVEALEVIWPDGKTYRIAKPEVNQFLKIYYPVN